MQPKRLHVAGIPTPEKWRKRKSLKKCAFQKFPPVLLDGGKRHGPGRPAASPSGRPGRELSSHPVDGEGRLNSANWGER